MPLTLILSVGSYSLLLESIHVALQDAGFIVVTAPSVNTAIHLIRDGDFDLLFLDGSCSSTEKERIVRSIRGFGSRIPIIFAESGSVSVCATASAAENIDPSPILASIREALRNSQDMVPARTRKRKRTRMNF